METTAAVEPHTKKHKSWTEKMNPKMQPRIITDMSARWQEKFGSGKMLIATPHLVDHLIRQVPKGKLVTVNFLREKLARDFKTDYACPVTTGIYTWIIANAAEESLKNHKRKVSPYWRVIKENGQLNPKYPGGAHHQANLLRKEGFTIKPTTNATHLKVENYKDHLIQFD